VHHAALVDLGHHRREPDRDRQQLVERHRRAHPPLQRDTRERVQLQRRTTLERGQPERRNHREIRQRSSDLVVVGQPREVPRPHVIRSEHLQQDRALVGAPHRTVD
jgi:hypothetical protein